MPSSVHSVSGLNRSALSNSAFSSAATLCLESLFRLGDPTRGSFPRYWSFGWWFFCIRVAGFVIVDRVYDCHLLESSSHIDRCACGGGVACHGWFQCFYVLDGSVSDAF